MISVPPLRTSRRLAYVTAPLLVVALVLTYTRLPIPSQYALRYLDLDVYRLGAAQLRAGLPLYADLPPVSNGTHLPFTYPPLAALLFLPLTFGTTAVAGVLMNTVSLLALGYAVYLTLRHIGHVETTPALWLLPPILLAALALEPVNRTLLFGQVNLVLLMAVLADVLLPRTPWPRGALIGLVAAVKLTPAVFVLYLLARRDIVAAATTVVTAVSATFVAWLVLPADSREYWFSTLGDPSRIGGIAFAGNQSLNGVLARFLGPGYTGGALWLVAVAAALLLGGWLLWRLGPRGDGAEALVVTALIGLLASPISWSHHWVWAIPILAVLVRRARAGHGPLWWGLVISGIVVFASWSQMFVPRDDAREYGWNLLHHVIGDTYVWWGLAVLVALAVTELRSHPAARSMVSEPRGPRLR